MKHVAKHVGQHDTGSHRSLRIGELAAEAGVNPKTIRYYEEIGLLPAPERSPSGYRQYREQDRERLAFIRRAKHLGLSLDEIRGILEVSESGETPCEHVLHLVDRKIEATARQLHALTAYYRRLVQLRTSARHLTGRRAADQERCVCGIIERDPGVGGHAPRPALGAAPGPLELPPDWRG